MEQIVLIALEDKITTSYYSTRLVSFVPKILAVGRQEITTNLVHGPNVSFKNRFASFRISDPYSSGENIGVIKLAKAILLLQTINIYL